MKNNIVAFARVFDTVAKFHSIEFVIVITFNFYSFQLRLLLEIITITMVNLDLHFGDGSLSLSSDRFVVHTHTIQTMTPKKLPYHRKTRGSLDALLTVGVLTDRGKRSKTEML